MGHQRINASKVGVVMWALILGIGFVALGTSVLMPSTKSARIVKPGSEEAGPATLPVTRPATQATQPVRQRVLMPGSKSAPVFEPQRN
ncbi:MAG TPA: hypothetical protein VGQ99_16500 [Tepidisphaeraceae bacterium]|jgi:hypothetical protein|nr:hypothetical protein [Tepidisphaeraceae bacterium]